MFIDAFFAHSLILSTSTESCSLLGPVVGARDTEASKYGLCPWS